MEPVDIKSNTYIYSKKENYNKNTKFKIGDIVRISKYKNIFEKVVNKIGLKKLLWLKCLKSLSRGHILFMLLVTKKLLQLFSKNNCKKGPKRI